ncbi:MAG: PadR family transcriptional regulator [Thermoplasmata archaeon]|nr:PadR family transcriptional regulator [Thermoplasmata archaeon]
MAMLHIISRGEITGYGLIKEVEGLTGIRPSPGAIYPILKSMKEEGWVEAERRGGKVYYRISPGGEEKLKEIQELREEYLKKLHQTLSLASEIFHHGGEVDDLTVMGMILPLVSEVTELMRSRKDIDEVKLIIRRAIESLKKLKGEGDDERCNN